jgi:hypothetical protein
MAPFRQPTGPGIDTIYDPVPRTMCKRTRLGSACGDKSIQAMSARTFDYGLAFKVLNTNLDSSGVRRMVVHTAVSAYGLFQA